MVALLTDKQLARLFRKSDWGTITRAEKELLKADYEARKELVRKLKDAIRGQASKRRYAVGFYKPAGFIKCYVPSDRWLFLKDAKDWASTAVAELPEYKGFKYVLFREV